MRIRRVTIIFTILICYEITDAALAHPQELTFSRPTIVGILLDRPPNWHFKIFEDEKYVFVFRDYGNAEYAPGIFVYHREDKKWLEIRKISTENAVLGHSPATKDISKCPIPVTWDFAYLKDNEYAVWPLKTGGLLFIPDTIVKEEERNVYRIDTSAECGLAYTLTRFFIRFNDLDDAFNRPKPNSQEIIFKVDHYRAPCFDEKGNTRLCYQVARGENSNEFPYFYHDIAGFKFQWGHEYRLLVVEEAVPRYKVRDPLYTYRLVKILSDKVTQPQKTFFIQLKHPELGPYFTTDETSNIYLLGDVKISVITPKLKTQLLQLGKSAKFISGTFKHNLKQDNVITLISLSFR